MAYKASPAHDGPVRGNSHPYIFDDRSRLKGSVFVDVWNELVAKSPRLKAIRPGETYFDSQKNQELVADYWLAAFRCEVVSRAVEVCYSFGFIVCYRPSENDFKILSELSDHLNELVATDQK